MPCVVSDVEKAPVKVSGGDQEGERKRIADDVSLYGKVASEPGPDRWFWDESGGYPIVGQAVSGMEATRA